MKELKIRTDLALEAADTGDGKTPNGVFVSEVTENGVKKTCVEIKTVAAAKRLNRKKGRYITLEGDFSQKSEMVDMLAESVTDMLPDGAVLVVGFGNQQITPDTIGPLAAQKIMATSHLPKKMKEDLGLQKLREVSVIFPGAMGQTGIETTDFVKTLVNKYNFAGILTIDALAARSTLRLGNTLQIANSGISPGSGVGNSRRECSEDTMGIPVISVGVPTVTDAFTVFNDYSPTALDLTDKENFMLTPKDIDEIVRKSVDVISLGLNYALQGGLTREELQMFL